MVRYNSVCKDTGWSGENMVDGLSDSKQSQDSLSQAILRDIDYHVLEYKMTYDEVISCLEIIKLNMWSEYNNDEDG